MYATLGWINAFLLALLLAPYVGNRVQRHFFQNKNEGLKKLTRGLRSIHKPVAALLLILGVVHGYLALGRIALHTGTLLYLSILLTVSAGIAFWRVKNKNAFKGHKFFAMLTVLLFLLHLLFPGAMYYLLRSI